MSAHQRRIRFLLALSCGAVTSGQAQTEPSPTGRWSFGLGIGTATFTGAASGVSDQGDHLSFVPHRPTMVSGRVGFGKTTRVELSVAFGTPGLALYGGSEGSGGAPDENVFVVAKGFYDLYTVSAEVSRRLLRFRGGPELFGVAGVFGERWASPESPGRTIGGVLGALAVEFALFRRISARGLAGLGYSPASPFLEADLPEGFTSGGTLRRQLSVGLQYR